MGFLDRLKRLVGLEPPEHLQGKSAPPPEPQDSSSRGRPSKAGAPRSATRSKHSRRVSPQKWRTLRPGLPRIEDAAQLRERLGLDAREYEWLVDRHRITARRNPHYRLSVRTKSSGGFRIVLAPRPRLKAVQRWILHNVLDELSSPPAVHGFVKGRSIVSNAQAHVGRAVVLKMDFQDFFQQFTHRNVIVAFLSLGYSVEVARDLALLTTAPTRCMAPRLLEQWNADPEHRPLSPREFQRAVGQFARQRSMLPCLPQGAPTSPALANLCCEALDRRLEGLAGRFEARYTRYADDLCFSGDAEFRRGLRRFVPLVRKIARQHQLALAEHKLHVTRRGSQQRVTGLVVNDQVAVPAAERRRLRAILHQCRRNGPASQNRDGHRDFRAHLAGRIGHVLAANPRQGKPLLEAFRAIDWTA